MAENKQQPSKYYKRAVRTIMTHIKTHIFGSRVVFAMCMESPYDDHTFISNMTNELVENNSDFNKMTEEEHKELKTRVYENLNYYIEDCYDDDCKAMKFGLYGGFIF